MQHIKQYIKSISLTGDATGGTPMERGRDMGEAVAAGPVKHPSFVLRRSHALSNLLRRSRFMRSTAILSLFLLILATSAILVPVYNNISVTEAATGTAQSSTLTLNITKASASVDLSVHDSNGTFASSSSDDSVSFNIVTNNYTGYELSLGNYNTTTNLVSGSNYLTTIADTISSSTFSAANGTDYNGKWGYLPSKYNSTSNTTNYYPAPAINSTTTLDKTSTSNSTANEYTIGVGARATYSQATGTYSNTFTLTAVANRINYSITYNANAGSDTVGNMPSTQAGDTSATSITLSSNTPLRTGYTFKGWCTASTSDESCSGTTYQPGATYGIDQTTINTATFYAVWEELIYMQNLASSQCTTTASTVYDSRDNTAYTIQRLADGNCWLLDNLALDLVTYKNSITSSNTNATDEQIAYLKNGGGTASDQYATSGIINWPAGTTNNYSYSVPYQQTDYKDITSSGGYAAGKYGVYYNYCAASAGTYCYGNGTSYGSPSGNAIADICPKGWRMPTGSDSGEYQTLYNKYGNYSSFVAALHTPLSGLYYTGTTGYQGSRGYFWSSTYYNAHYIYMYYLILDASNVHPAEHLDRNSGSSVRCVLEERVFMQDVTEDDLATLLPNSGDTTTLYDNRDNTAYTVGKLADGNYWLLDNLALDLVANKSVLSSANTNATDAELAYLKGTSTGTTSDQYATSGVINWPTGTSNNYSYSVPYQQTGYKNATGTGGYAAGKYGVYYNYCAASAGTYCYGNGTSQGSPSGDASADICPKGWRMPTGNTSGEYQALYNKYNAYNAFVAALHTPLSGTYTNGSAYDQGSAGFFWSSTYYNATNMYSLTLATSGVSPANTNTRYNGYSVRCIFKTPITSGTYMQDITSSMVASTDENVPLTLTDKRDNNTYTVKKINGQLWMTQNLRFVGASTDPVGTMTLKADTTNVASDTTISYGNLTAGNSPDATFLHVSTDATHATEYGVYYNYAIATAKTITGANNDTAARYDICPAGWHLPSGPSTTANTDFNKLVGNTTYGFQAATTGLTAFDAVAAGYYGSGSLLLGGSRGHWWSATASSPTYRYYLDYNSNNGQFHGGNDIVRDSGLSIRCVRSS